MSKRLTWRTFWVIAGLVILIMGISVGYSALAQDSGGDPEDWVEEPWTDDWPDETVPGEKTDEGYEFETPFLTGASAFLAEFVDCLTGEPIEDVETEFYFHDHAEPPYGLEDLERVVAWAEGYQPAEITEFETFTFGLFFFQAVMVMPAGGQPVCMDPAVGDGEAWFSEDEEEPEGPPPTPTPTPPAPHPGVCDAFEVETKVYKVIYHPTSTEVIRGRKPNGGLETTFKFHFDREEFIKGRTRGPCTLPEGHSGAHSPWTWSKWEKKGSITTPVTFTKTIGGWPTGMSSTYFDRWILSFCYQNLASIGLLHLKYVTGSFDAKRYYDTYVKPSLQ